MVIAVVVAVVPVDVVWEVHAAGAVVRSSGVQQRRDGDNDDGIVTA